MNYTLLQFDDLNDDVLLKIFDEFEFERLLDVANMNYRFRQLITQHTLIPKYQLNEKSLMITISDGAVARNIFFDTHSFYYIENREFALKFLRNFGHVVPRILFNKCVFPQWHRRISSYINEHCNESLERLEIGAFDEDMLLQWKKPFKNVITLQFNYGSCECKDNNINISKIFPSLRYFELKWLSHLSSKCIEYHFPKLEHIQFSMKVHASYTKNNSYENFFELNPQLRSIHITNMINADLLRVISEKVNCLETIRLTIMGPDFFDKLVEEVIRFESVKQFYVRLAVAKHGTPNFIPFEFDQLEEIEFESDRTFNPVQGKWIEYIAKQHKLKSLKILWSLLNLQQWTSIVESLPQLKVITTYWKPANGNNGIAGVMRTKTTLKKIILINLLEREYNVLKEIIDQGWQIAGEVERSMKQATFIYKEDNL